MVVAGQGPEGLGSDLQLAGTLALPPPPNPLSVPKIVVQIYCVP